MYIYIHNGWLFVLNPRTGRIYRFTMSIREEPQFEHFDTLSFEADIQKHIADFKATLVRDVV